MPGNRLDSMVPIPAASETLADKANEWIRSVCKIGRFLIGYSELSFGWRKSQAYEQYAYFYVGIRNGRAS